MLEVFQIAALLLKLAAIGKDAGESLKALAARAMDPAAPKVTAAEFAVEVQRAKANGVEWHSIPD